MNPYADFAYDGVLLNPLEVVFVKVKRFQQEANWGSARLAAAYSRWMDQEVSCLSSVPSCHLPCVPGAASTQVLMMRACNAVTARTSTAYLHTSPVL